MSRGRHSAAPTDGVLAIDKPAGLTSHDVVAACATRWAGCATGHAGTLDPFATGLLLVLVGRATKAQRELMALAKTYETVAQLGATSSTGDTEGEIAETGELPADPLSLPTGELRQRPPAYSAVKIGGERAYKRARRGEQLQMPERIVAVTRFQQLWREPDPEHAGLQRAGYLIECGSGTYVRSLIADLGDAYCLAAAPHGDRAVCGRPGRRSATARRALERSTADRARRKRSTCSRAARALGFAAVKVTRLPDVERNDGAASRSAPSTACISATAR